MNSPAVATLSNDQSAPEANCERRFNPGGLFSGEYARKMSKLAVLARKAAADRRKAAAIIEAEAERRRIEAGWTPPTIENYPAKRLSRVRAQLDKLDAMIADEVDPQKLDRLASAQAKLSEQERILDGRPMPGAYRPLKPRKGVAIDVAPAFEE